MTFGFAGFLLIDRHGLLPRLHRPNQNWHRKKGTGDFRSGEDFFDDVAVDIGQAKVAARVTIRKFFVVKPQEVENGRVQIVHVDNILDSLEAKLIRCAVDVAALDAAARQPH